MLRSSVLSLAALVVMFGSVPSAGQLDGDGRRPESAVQSRTVLAVDRPPSFASTSASPATAGGIAGIRSPDALTTEGSLTEWAELSFNDLLKSALAVQRQSEIDRLSPREAVIRRIILQEGDLSSDDVGSLDPADVAALRPTTDDHKPVGSDQVPAIVNPVPGATLVDSFGFPRSNGRRHRGIDIFAPAGSPVVAAVGGAVVQVRGPGARPEGALGGRTVTILGTDGNFHYYAHNSENLVTEGEIVRQGTVVALVGNSGNARTTPPHLHYAVSVGGSRFSESRAVNPFPLLMAAAEGEPQPAYESLTVGTTRPATTATVSTGVPSTPSSSTTTTVAETAESVVEMSTSTTGVPPLTTSTVTAQTATG